MTDHVTNLIIDPNLTSFAGASLRRALKNCDITTRRRLATLHPNDDKQDVVTIATAHITTHDGRQFTITPEHLDDPTASAGSLSRPAESIVLDVARRDAPLDEPPVPVNADLLMFGWPGNEVVITAAGRWSSDDRLLLADTIREAALQSADGDPFWKADSHEYACRTRAISELLLADEFQSFTTSAATPSAGPAFHARRGAG